MDSNLVRSLVEKASGNRLISCKPKTMITAEAASFADLVSSRKLAIKSQYSYLPLEDIVAFYDLDSGDHMFLTKDGDILRYNPIAPRRILKKKSSS